MSRRLRKTCPACMQVKVLTKHHILPKRYFRNSPIMELCRECHDALEQDILQAERVSGKQRKLKRHEYYRVLIRFMRGEKHHDENT
jgi:uncharacterized protein YlaI